MKLIFPIGSFLGLIFINMISDVKGKKYASLLCTATIIFGCTLTLLS